MERTGIRYVPLLEKGDRFESMVTYLLRLVTIIRLTISIMHRQEEQRIVGETMLPCILMQMVEAAALQVC